MAAPDRGPAHNLPLVEARPRGVAGGERDLLSGCTLGCKVGDCVRLLLLLFVLCRSCVTCSHLLLHLVLLLLPFLRLLRWFKTRWRGYGSSRRNSFGRIVCRDLLAATSGSPSAAPASRSAGLSSCSGSCAAARRAASTCASSPGIEGASLVTSFASSDWTPYQSTLTIKATYGSFTSYVRLGIMKLGASPWILTSLLIAPDARSCAL